MKATLTELSHKTYNLDSSKIDAKAQTAGWDEIYDN